MARVFFVNVNSPSEDFVHITTLTRQAPAFGRLLALFALLGLFTLGSQLPGRSQAEKTDTPAATTTTDSAPAPDSMAAGDNASATGSADIVTGAAKHARPTKAGKAKTARKKGKGLIGNKQAVVLGIVEGITEFLPVSSTGHLLLTQSLMKITGKTEEEKTAIDAYLVIIQFGAILAVLLLFWGRVTQVFSGLVGQNKNGLRLGINLIVALLPAAVIGVLVEKHIHAIFDNFAMQTVMTTWFVGGVIILIVDASRRKTVSAVDKRMAELNAEEAQAQPENTSKVGKTVEELTPIQALAIGGLQCISMLPGTSRSLTTILGGLWVGLSMAAAVEFSFLLGLITLTAATIFEMRHVKGIIHTLHITAPMIGIIFAGIAAFVAVKWMIGYLNKHGLGIFGYYRIVAAAAVLALLAANLIK